MSARGLSFDSRIERPLNVDHTPWPLPKTRSAASYVEGKTLRPAPPATSTRSGSAGSGRPNETDVLKSVELSQAVFSPPHRARSFSPACLVGAGLAELRLAKRTRHLLVEQVTTAFQR